MILAMTDNSLFGVAQESGGQPKLEFCYQKKLLLYKLKFYCQK